MVLRNIIDLIDTNRTIDLWQDGEHFIDFFVGSIPEKYLDCEVTCIYLDGELEPNRIDISIKGD